MRDPSLAERDPEIAKLIEDENRREHETIRLIASENYASRAVMEATGSCLTNKYSEGYAHKRYYEGQQVVDQVEELAIAGAALREDAASFGGGDCTSTCSPTRAARRTSPSTSRSASRATRSWGSALPAGGHLTHGHTVSITGKYFKSVPYGVRKDDHRIDLDEVRELAQGAPAEAPLVRDDGVPAHARLRRVPRDRRRGRRASSRRTSRTSRGSSARACIRRPIGIADVVTSTTHKTFRGPRGGMIFCKKEHAAAIDRAVFPGLQGGPHNHTPRRSRSRRTRRRSPSSRRTRRTHRREREGARRRRSAERGFGVVTGRHRQPPAARRPDEQGRDRARQLAQALDRAGIVLNYNAVPFDPRKPFDPSGVRIGTPAVTSRGMGAEVMDKLADWIDRVVQAPSDEALLAKIAGEVNEVCAKYPAPGIRI